MKAWVKNKIEPIEKSTMIDFFPGILPRFSWNPLLFIKKAVSDMKEINNRINCFIRNISFPSPLGAIKPAARKDDTEITNSRVLKIISTDFYSLKKCLSNQFYFYHDALIRIFPFYQLLIFYLGSFF